MLLSSLHHDPHESEASLISLLIAFLILTAGCTATVYLMDNQTPDAYRNPPCKIQTNHCATRGLCNLDKNGHGLYTVGDVVKFTVTNDKSGDISCLNDPPTFSVQYQDGTGRWVFRMGGKSCAR